VASDEEPVQPQDTPSATVFPSASAMEPAPVPEVLPEGAPRIDVHVTGPSSEPSNGMNLNDLLRFAISTMDRTKNLESIIWTLTAPSALFIGAVSVLVIVTTHFRVEGLVGLASAGIAAVSGIWRWARKIRQSRGS
jgi:hypothetical protein